MQYILTVVPVMLSIMLLKRQAGSAFALCCAFDAEEFAIDLYYWFDKSTKRKNELQSYCEFCDQEYRAIIKHVSTR